MSAATAEAEVLEYVLGLDGLGLGGQAFAIYGRTAVEVRPLALKSKALLTTSSRRHDAGLTVPDEADAPAVDLDTAQAAVWSACLNELKLLWILKANHEDEDGGAF